MPAIDRLFQAMQKAKGSDLHLAEGQPPKYRVHGHIEAIPGEPPLTHDTLAGYLQEICPSHHWEKYVHKGDCDFAYAMGVSDRFRANYYKHQRGYGAIFRIIPTKILTLEQLGAPQKLFDFTETKSGLLLVTGPTGSGKSTTLAAMINEINEKKARHILTIEEPIEFVHPPKKSIVTQREVGDHTKGFGPALRAASREDCDVILVGEMRDLETISLAVSASEMGVLVFGTLHTNSAAKTIDRVVNVFPPGQQPMIRGMLSGSLRGVVSQLLCRKKDGGGRVAAQEILVTNTAIQAAIREGKIAKLNQLIAAGKGEGMITMDDRLQELVDAETISKRECYMKALDKKRFEEYSKDEEGH
ncbi:MAG: type IV pilus twitching motility protein PilT [Planctomycetota bacterium]|nr:type IV pilus twitching motility protein PilT [Planctomycetota bacterium]